MQTDNFNKCPPIRYFADLNPGTGYNHAARGYILCLRALGFDPTRLRVVPAVRADFKADDIDAGDWLLEHVCGDWAGDDKINIVHLNPGMVGNYYTPINERYNIAITAWETDRLPEKSYDRGGKKRTIALDLSDYDEVWVPTRYTREVLKKSGVTSDIHVIPHALLPEFCTDEPFFRRDPKERVLMYYIGSWNVRKNARGLFAAYLQTGFNPADPVELSMHCVPPSREIPVVQIHGMRATDEAKDLVESMSEPSSVPQYGLHTRYRPLGDIAQMHRFSDIFVTASRGESFCLPMVEAAASGSWVIASGPWAEELAEVAGSVKDGGIVDVVPSRITPITPMPEVKGYELTHQWFQPDQAELINAIQGNVFAAKETRGDEVNHEAAARVREYYGLRRISGLIAERLQHAMDVVEASGW